MRSETTSVFYTQTAATSLMLRVGAKNFIPCLELFSVIVNKTTFIIIISIFIFVTKHSLWHLHFSPHHVFEELKADI